MQIQIAIDSFLKNLLISRRLSKNTLSSYKSDLNHFIAFLKDKEIFLIPEIIENQEIIEEYFNFLRNASLKRNSFSRKFTSLNLFFKFLKEQDFIKENPIFFTKKPKLEKKIPQYVDFDVIKQLLEVKISKKEEINILKDLVIIFLSYAGLRVSEVCSLQMKDIENLITEILKNRNSNFSKQEKNVFLIKIKGKGEKERLVPFHKSHLSVLDKYLVIRENYLKKNNEKSSYLFASNSKDGFLSRRYFFKIINLASQKLNLNIKIHPHLLRHSFATNLLKKGMDIRNIQELLGHANISTTAIYTEIENDKIYKILTEMHPILDF